MASQWETAKHCHMSLSVLAAKIKQAEASSDPARSQAYATRGPEGSPALVETLNAREERRQELGGQPLSEEHYSRTEGASFEQPAHQAIDPNIHYAGIGQNTTSTQLPNRDEHGYLVETPSSLQMDFQDTDTAHFEGISNFDLNIVDLIQGANFDTLFDLGGQQYPSF